MTTNKVRISGKVQGVYFRASAKQIAMNLGIRGFVRNESDGSVIMEIEGDNNAVDDMVKWCKKGSALARVSSVEVSKEASRNFVSFDIKK
ncbi:MAG: acylphosphatase [Bacteroidetes bacterium]|nr:MAG: acylphosphatase [Bacteroidota bacterium]